MKCLKCAKEEFIQGYDFIPQCKNCGFNMHPNQIEYPLKKREKIEIRSTKIDKRIYEALYSLYEKPKYYPYMNKTAYIISPHITRTKSIYIYQHNDHFYLLEITFV